LKGTNAHNRFSLGDVILKCFKYPDDKYRYYADLSRIKIRRLDPATGQEKVIPIDFDAILTQGDPESDIRLEWGDIVEVPEADHLINEKWPGPKKEWATGLNKILLAYIQVVVRGQTNHFMLKPIKDVENDPVTIDVTPDGKLELRGSPRNPGHPFLEVPSHVFKRISAPVQGIRIVDQELLCWLYSVLRQAGVIRASSDLSRVKVTRDDPSTGQHTTVIFDSREQDLVNDLWLRNGDVIEIPDKE